MHIKKDFVVRTIAGQDVVVPIGENIAKFNGIISLNETAAFLWRALQRDTDAQGLIQALRAEYDVSEQLAQRDVDQFLTLLREHDLLEPET